MTGLTPHRTIHWLRASGRTAVAIGAMMLMVAFLLPGLTPAAEAQPEDKCTEYYFLYTDGHPDQGEVCDGPVNELHIGTHGIHVPNLHISCSDGFDVAIMEDDDIVGWGSDGDSDLGDHLIADIGGVAQWAVRKSWTGGDDCGLVAPPPPSDPDPANPAAALAFDCTDGLSLLATNDGDEDADLTVLQGANVIDAITVPKNTTTETEYLVDGEDIAEDGSAHFTVKFGETTLVDGQIVSKDCDEPEENVEPTPSIDVEKLLSLDGGSTYQDVDTASEAPTTLALNDPTPNARFRVVVTNTSGDGTALTITSLTDAVEVGSLAPLNLTGCDIPAILEDGGSFTCDVDAGPAWLAEPHANRVTVSATGADQTVGDNDPAHYSLLRIGGEVFERPEPPPAPEPAPEPEVVAEPEPAPEVLGVTNELPRTGPEDLWLAGLGLMLLGAGLLTVARGKAMDATAYATGTWWMNHTP